MKYLSIIIMSFFIVSCSTSKSKHNSRDFQFTYSVDLNPTANKKLELWIPIPQSNPVQTISNLNIDSQGLIYQIKNEMKIG